MTVVAAVQLVDGVRQQTRQNRQTVLDAAGGARQVDDECPACDTRHAPRESRCGDLGAPFRADGLGDAGNLVVQE